jgi:hypothetical protein
MKLSDIRKSKKPDKMKAVWQERELASGKPEKTIQEMRKESKPAFMSDEYRTKKIQQKQERLQEKQKLWEEKEAYKQRKEGRKMEVMEAKRLKEQKKLQMQVIKTQKAEFKMRQRDARFGKVREGLIRTLEKPDVKSRATIETAQYKRSVVGREREKQRAELEAEREYTRKFGVKQEGEGELPHYEREHGKPLPCRQVEEKKVIPKKSFRDELF